ncbi:MAG: sensor histidine kinase [Caldisericaceae bacterium]
MALSVVLIVLGKFLFGIIFASSAIVVLVFTYHMILKNLRSINLSLYKLSKIDVQKMPSEIKNNEFGEINKTVSDLRSSVIHLLEKIRIREGEFVAILDAITSPVFIVNEDGKIIIKNVSSKKIMRRPTQTRDYDFYYEAIRSDELNGFIKNSLGTRTKESRLIKIDEVFYEITSFPFSSEGEEYLLLYANDMTEKEISRIMQRDFTESLSHELRTPLSVINGIVEIIKNENLIEKNGTRFLKPLSENLDRINEIALKTATLLEVDSFEGKVDEKVDLSKVAKEVKDSFEPLAKSKGLELVSDIEEDVFINGNALLLHEMVSNLIENAIKYTDKGYVKIAVKSGEFVTLTVFDTGRGVDSKFIDRIFEPFSREDISRNKESGGLGLGLSITNRIVRLHHGTISVESQKNKFSNFTVSLPLLRRVNKKLT